MNRIKLSKRDLMDSTYEPKGFNAESATPFQKNFVATSLARELYYQGYNSLASMTKQFEERNYKVDADAKKIIKAVIEKLEITWPQVKHKK